MKFSIDTDVFKDLFTSEQPVEDIEVDYNISGLGNIHFKALDTSFFKDGVAYFRPFVRGFIVLMLFLYNIRQLIGFFGYDAGVVAGRSEWISYNKKDTGGHKS